MTDTSTVTPTETLGVGALIGEAFSLMLGNLKLILPLAAIPALVGLIMNLAVSGPAILNPALAFTDPAAYLAATGGGPAWYVTLVMSIVGIALWGFSAAAVTKAAYEIKMGNEVSLSECLGVGLSRLVPAALCSILAFILAYLAMFAVLVPGLYVAGLFAVVVPVIVAEGLGFAALGRSAALTKGYRWPMVGLVLLSLIVILVIAMFTGALQFVVAMMGVPGMVIAALLSILSSGLFYGLASVIVALAYARLREIKEGMSISQISEIFS